MGPLVHNLGLRTPVESYIRATEVAFKVGDEALFPTSTHAQKMAARPIYSLLGLGSPSWYPFRVPTSVYIVIIGRRGMQGLAPPPSDFWPGHMSGPSIQNRKKICAPLSLSTLVGGPGTKVSMKRPHFGGISIFLRFWAFWGSGVLVFFWGPHNGQKSQKK